MFHVALRIVRLGIQKKASRGSIIHACIVRGKVRRGKYSRHPHWEATNHEFVVERLENQPADRRVVDSSIFVVLQIRQFMLPDVHHCFGCLARR